MAVSNSATQQLSKQRICRNLPPARRAERLAAAAGRPPIKRVQVTHHCDDIT